MVRLRGFILIKLKSLLFALCFSFLYSLDLAQLVFDQILLFKTHASLLVTEFFIFPFRELVRVVIHQELLGDCPFLLLFSKSIADIADTVAVDYSTDLKVFRQVVGVVVFVKPFREYLVPEFDCLQVVP